jgi:hypothetical protein
MFQNVQFFWKYVEEVLQKIMKFHFLSRVPRRVPRLIGETGKSSKAFSINLKVLRHARKT